MHDKFISEKDLTKELKEIKDEGIKLAQNLSLLSQKIKYIFTQIKLCETLTKADVYFNLLDDIQIVLASLIYNEDIGIPDRLRRFVNDFDNFEFYKEHYFEKIKNDEYSF